MGATCWHGGLGGHVCEQQETTSPREGTACCRYKECLTLSIRMLRPIATCNRPRSESKRLKKSEPRRSKPQTSVSSTTFHPLHPGYPMPWQAGCTSLRHHDKDTRSRFWNRFSIRRKNVHVHTCFAINSCDPDTA